MHIAHGIGGSIAYHLTLGTGCQQIRFSASGKTCGLVPSWEDRTWIKFNSGGLLSSSDRAEESMEICETFGIATVLLTSRFLVVWYPIKLRM